MDEAKYHAARGELERLEAIPSPGPDTLARIETLRREIRAFEQGARSKGWPDQQ